jgi:hypothetical protein
MYGRVFEPGSYLPNEREGRLRDKGTLDSREAASLFKVLAERVWPVSTI